jgi:hypothetical protein
MKYLLAPFVASRPEEQRNFYAFWDHLVADLEREWADEKEPEGIVSTSSGGWSWLLLPILCLLAYGAYRFFNPKPPLPQGEHYAIRIGLPDSWVDVDSTYAEFSRLIEGDTLRLLNRTHGKLRGPDSTGFRWRLEDSFTDSVLFTSQDFHLEMARPLVQGEGFRAILLGDHLALPIGKTADTLNFFVGCANPPEVPFISAPEGPLLVGETYQFSIRTPKDDEVYDWEIGDLGMQGTTIETSFDQEGQVSITVRAIRGRLENIELCNRWFKLGIQVVPKGYDLPILASLPLVKDEPHTFASRSPAFKWGMWLTGLFLFLPYALWKYRQFKESRREKTDEEIAEAYPIFDQGPYNVPYRSKNDQISVPADFYRIADHLRVREEAEARVFDGPATIEATVNSGGFPSWQEQSLHRPADYLVLVTHNDEFNQQDLLLKRLTDFLSAREAAITVYYHEGQFEHFWNKDYPRGWSADRLFDRYQQYRLLVLGNAHGLVDAYASREPQLEPTKAKWLNGWARRLVLTTEPSADWTVQEVLLHRQTLLYPLTMRGLNEGVRMLNVTEEYEPEDFPKWRTVQQQTNPEPSARYRKWETVADHEEYLREDPELMRWLRGLAVTGNPDWNLTIAIGRALNIEVTHDRLLQLSRIPWLAGNRPDHDLRFALMEHLSPADDAAARMAVIKELELVEGSVQGSFAQTEWQTNLAVHQLHLAPASAPQKASLREMIRAGLFTSDQLRDLELAAQRKEQPVEQLQTKGGPPPPPPGGLDRLLAKDERAWKDTRSGRIVIGTIALATCLMLLVISQLTPERELAPGEAVPWWADVNVVDDAALEANNEAVALWEMTDASIKEQGGDVSIENATALGTIKNQLKQAWNLRGENYQLVANNRWKASLNEEGYRLNAAYLDLAADKEVAFRDLLEEEDAIEWAGASPDDLSPTVEHQHGLTLLGLYQTLNEKYPLADFPPSERSQLEKEFPDIRWQSSAITGLISAEGKLPNGRNVRELRDERDSLYADATSTLRLIEQVTNGLYFDSLTVVMPVNLRTMVEALREEQSGNEAPDMPQQQLPVEEPVTDPVQNTPPTTNPPVEESVEVIEFRKLLERYGNFRFQKYIDLKVERGQQKRFLTDFTPKLDALGADKMIFGLDGPTMLKMLNGKQSDLLDHDSESVMLFGPQTTLPDQAASEEFKNIQRVVVIVTIDKIPGSDNEPENGLASAAKAFGEYFDKRGWTDFQILNPTQETLGKFLSEIEGNGYGEKDQLMIVVNTPIKDRSLLAFNGNNELTEISDINARRFSDLFGATGHSLVIENTYEISPNLLLSDPQQNTGNPVPDSGLSATKLLALIQEAGNRRAAISARAVKEQADKVENQNNNLIGSMATQSGGYDRGGKLLYPSDKVAVEQELLKRGGGNDVQTEVTRFANLLDTGYAGLSVPGSGDRISALRKRFNNAVLIGKQNWDAATFTGLTISEAVPILEEISADTRAAEKAYLLALLESLDK